MHRAGRLSPSYDALISGRSGTLRETAMRRASILAALVVSLLLFDTGPAVAQTVDECTSLKDNRKKLEALDAAIKQLEDADLPDQLANQMIEVIDQLIEGLEGTKADLSHITGAVDKAKNKLKEIGEKIG